jgi:2,4-dienoyl-CoA reductase-like NADH-dependent reductase (Old Yellow Enzyme family)/thioredoxin reductase
MFKQLSSPISIGTMWLKNRMVMAPMVTGYCDEEQMPSEKLLRYYEERAKGGVGLITMELMTIDETHRYMHRSLSFGSDRYIDAHRRVTDTIHQHGCKIQPQLSHAGPESVAPLFGKVQPVGPSVIVSPVWGWPCRVLGIEELPEIIRQYGRAALRAREAGYDGVELHAAHCDNLLGSFLSPLRNKRTDEYSGFKLHTRLRLIKEVLHEIKSQAGNDFPVTLCISGYERFPGGRPIDDTQKIAPQLVAAGVDCFRVSGGISDSLVTMMVNRSEHGDALNAAQAEAIKLVVDVPVMTVGRVHSPEIAERIIASGQADLVVMGRPLLADPMFAKKVIGGNAKAIRGCISCESCVDFMQVDDKLSCAINPEVGREFELPFKSSSSKKVLVVGAGAAGLEAARLAASAGHRVSLYESQARLGGSLVMASAVHKDNERYLKWLLEQIKRLPIDVHTGRKITAPKIIGCKPDAVIIATGAVLLTPDIPGVEQPHVITGALLRQIASVAVDQKQGFRLPAWTKFLINHLGPHLQRYFSINFFRNFTHYWMPLGRRVVIIGADLAAVEVAEFLAERGRKVHLLTTDTKIAADVGKKRRSEHMDRLDKLNVTVNTSINIERIEKQCVIISVAGREHTVKYDNVIVAGEPVGNLDLTDELRDTEFVVHSIGDCTGSGLIAKATRAAADAVSQL